MSITASIIARQRMFVESADLATIVWSPFGSYIFISILWFTAAAAAYCFIGQCHLNDVLVLTPVVCYRQFSPSTRRRKNSYRYMYVCVCVKIGRTSGWPTECSWLIIYYCAPNLHIHRPGADVYILMNSCGYVSILCKIWYDVLARRLKLTSEHIFGYPVTYFGVHVP